MNLIDKLEQYFIENNKQKEHIKILLAKIFKEYNSNGIYIQLWNSIKKSPKFSNIGKGWVKYNN